MVEIEVERIIEIPARRIEPLPVPALPARALNRDLAETLAECQQTIDEANADRAWIKIRQNVDGKK